MDNTLERQILDSANGAGGSMETSPEALRVIEDLIASADKAAIVTPASAEKPFATPEEKEEIRSALKGKEDWKEVDFKLEEAFNELKGLERSQGDPARIKELRTKIDALKEQKFPSEVRGGRGTKGNPDEIKGAIEAAKQETTLSPSSDAQLLKSLETGEGFVAGGEEAEKAIAALIEKSEAAEGEKPAEPSAPVVAPLRSNYEAAIARIEEREAAEREEALAKNLKEALVPGAPTPEPVVLQAETAAKIEEPRIRPVLSREEMEKIAAKNAETRERATFSALNKINERNPAEAEKLLKVMGPLSVEQKALFQNVLGKVELQDQKVEAAAEKKGLLDKVRKVGEFWNTKVPKSLKYTIAAGMFAAGGGAWAAGYVVTSRVLGGAGMFVTLDTLFKNRHEKRTGGERSKTDEARHAAFAGIGAMAVVALLPAAFHELFVGDIIPTAGAAAPHEAMAASYAETAQAGDSVWKLAQHQLEAHYGERFTSLSPDQQRVFIDAVKDRVATDPQHFGMASANADTLGIGEKVNFEEIFKDKQFMEDHFSGTSHHVATPHEVMPGHMNLDLAATPEGEAPGPLTWERVPVGENAPTMPQEIAPTDPGIVAAAQKTTHDFVNNIFGTKGVFGFGAQDGMNTIDWKDPQVGFANQSVDKVLGVHPSSVSEDGARHFGIEDYSAHQKALTALKQVAEDTGVTHRPGETMLAYFNRAAIETLSKTPTTLNV